MVLNPHGIEPKILNSNSFNAFLKNGFNAVLGLIPSLPLNLLVYTIQCLMIDIRKPNKKQQYFVLPSIKIHRFNNNI